jgi:hypothetical protein
MNHGEKSKSYEVSYIAFSDTGPQPRTVVIMHFDADITFFTVERSWGSYDLTSLAIRQGYLPIGFFKTYILLLY